MNHFDWRQLLNPEFYILLKIGGVSIGIYVVLAIVFAESGLLAGFFLPGDSLLFLCGIYSETLMKDFSTGSTIANATLLATFIAGMGILGNMFGYWFGGKSGNYLYKKEDNFLFKKSYLTQAHDFFEKHGSRAIVFARFLPIIRTFAPVIAGMANMDKKRFMFYSILGAFVWSFILVFAGHFLHSFFLNKFQIDLKDYIEYIVIGIVGFTTLPVILKLVTGKKK